MTSKKKVCHTWRKHRHATLHTLTCSSSMVAMIDWLIDCWWCDGCPGRSPVTCARRLSSSASASALSSLLRRFRLELVIDLRRAISRTGKQGVSVALHQSINRGREDRTVFWGLLTMYYRCCTVWCTRKFLTGLCKDNRYLPYLEERQVSNKRDFSSSQGHNIQCNNNKAKGKEKVDIRI